MITAKGETMFGDVTNSSSTTTPIKYISCCIEDQRLSTEGKIDRFKILQHIENSWVGPLEPPWGYDFASGSEG